MPVDVAGCEAVVEFVGVEVVGGAGGGVITVAGVEEVYHVCWLFLLAHSKLINSIKYSRNYRVS